MVEEVVCCSGREENLDGKKRKQEGRGGSLPTPGTDLTPIRFTLLPPGFLMALPENHLQTHFLKKKVSTELDISLWCAAKKANQFSYLSF